MASLLLLSPLLETPSQLQLPSQVDVSEQLPHHKALSICFPFFCRRMRWCGIPGNLHGATFCATQATPDDSARSGLSRKSRWIQQGIEVRAGRSTHRDGASAGFAEVEVQTTLTCTLAASARIERRRKCEFSSFELDLPFAIAPTQTLESIMMTMRLL
jgi:hypothetical protein